MANTAAEFTFDLISPEAKLVSRPVWQVVCPGSEGEFGVRAGHMPVLASLKTGIVLVQDAVSSTPEAVFITGGFADVTPTQLTILAEEAVSVSDLDAASLQKAAESLAIQIIESTDALAQQSLQQALQIVQSKLAVVRKA